jgi:hypothetical protein
LCQSWWLAQIYVWCWCRKPIYWCCRDERKLSAEIKSLLTDQDFIVEIEGFDLFMLMLNAKLEHSPLIDPDDVLFAY